MTTTWNGLATWLDCYLAGVLGSVDGFEYAPDAPPEGDGVLVTVGYMPETPVEIVTVTGYAFPEHETGGRTGAVTASVQIRTRAHSRQTAISLADSASRHLCEPTLTARLDAVTRKNIQPLGQAPNGHHTASANLTVTTIERT